MADKLQQVVTDYEGTAGGNVKAPTVSNGLSEGPGKGAVMGPAESDRYGGKGYAERIKRASGTGGE